MKASRIVAVGLVVGAIGWVASGHLFPHETARKPRRHPHHRAERKPFRVAVIDPRLAPHARKLILSGRTEANKKVTITARTGGVLTEMRVKRGQHVKKGDVLAVLSDDAREAQVAAGDRTVQPAQGRARSAPQADRTRQHAKARAVNLESQFKMAESAAGAGHRRTRPRRPARPVGRHRITRAAEVGGAALSIARAQPWRRWSRSIRCWRSSRCRSAGSPD